MKSAQVDLVQQSWKKIMPNRAAFAARFYTTLFERDPTLRKLFKNDMRAQQTHFLTAMGIAIAGLKELHDIAPYLQQLGDRHGLYGVKKADFVSFTSAFFDTLSHELGATLTDEERLAWADAFRTIVTAMQVPA